MKDLKLELHQAVGEKSITQAHIDLVRQFVESKTGAPVYTFPVDFEASSAGVYLGSERENSIPRKINYLTNVPVESWFQEHYPEGVVDGTFCCILQFPTSGNLIKVSLSKYEDNRVITTFMPSVINPQEAGVYVSTDYIAKSSNSTSSTEQFDKLYNTVSSSVLSKDQE